MKTYNVVFEGGGIKGIGLVGAISAVKKAGITFSGYAGTSAGAIVAALMAAGFTAEEMKDIITLTNFTKFRQKTLLDKCGPIGSAINIFRKYGLYSSSYFEKWFADILAQKGVCLFGDIKNSSYGRTGQKYKFQAIASDITQKRILVLPDDLSLFGIDPDNFSIAKAVTMSVSIPVFFQPYKLCGCTRKDHIIVDGGILSNYPLWLFDKSPFETLSLRFSECDGKNDCIDKQTYEIKSFIDFLRHVAETMMDAHDKQHIAFGKGDFKRTIFISPLIEVKGKKRVVKTTEFEITDKEADALYENGVLAGEAFVRRSATFL